MKVRFHIHYNTQWGEQLAVSGDCPALGNGAPATALRMTHTGSGHWTAEAEMEGHGMWAPPHRGSAERAALDR